MKILHIKFMMSNSCGYFIDLFVNNKDFNILGQSYYWKGTTIRPVSSYTSYEKFYKTIKEIN